MTDEERYEWEQGLDAFCDGSLNESGEQWPIGSCVNCGVNLYEGDSYDGLCDQCEFFRMQNIPEQRASE